MSCVLQLQVFVLAGDNLVAVVLEKTPHLARPNRRQREAFLFSHWSQVCANRTNRARAMVDASC